MTSRMSKEERSERWGWGQIIKCSVGRCEDFYLSTIVEQWTDMNQI